jgi:hypothetical protein
VETLFAAQILLYRLHRYVSQQKLNLLQFTAGLMAQAGETSTQVVRLSGAFQDLLLWDQSVILAACCPA